MSNYPFSLDSILTLPTVSGSDEDSVAINALQDAVLAVEEELGIKPAFPYSNVRVRLDILESRINFGIPSTVSSDGYIKSPLNLWNTVQNVTLTISDGYGVPTESRAKGSLYMRADGYDNSELYIRKDGYWAPLQTKLWVAGGDLTGNYLSQTVIGLRGKSLNSSLASIGATQDGYHLTWSNSDGYWLAQTGFIAGGDLLANSPLFGRTSQKVVKIQGNAVTSVAPTDGYYIVWVAGDNQWEYQTRPFVFGGSVAAGDGYITRTNIRSNKILQSPSTNNASKVGMVNFGSRSAGTTVGTTENYAAILSGDRHVASGNFGVIIGGDSHIASNQYSLVGDGYGNVASEQYATVLNGTGNIASQLQSFVLNGFSNTVSGIRGFILDGYSNNVTGTRAFILDGYSNTVTGVNSYVLSGISCSPSADFSSILNGVSNTIAAGNTHAAIGFGSLNTITGAAATYSIILGGSGNTTNAQNVFIGTPTGANVQSNYGFVGTGINNTISTTSTHSAIVSGNTNAIAASSSFSFIGAGNNITATGLYATVLNATVATANGLHTTVLNGNTNNITATFSTIGNGNLNTISGNPAYATILDGYSNTVTGSGGLIIDGYSNTVSGIWSSVINGNNNSIASANTTILNGSSNIIDLNSHVNAILFGTANTLINTTRAVIAGHGNALTNVTSSYILGQSNTVQGNSIKITGDLNTVGFGANFNRIFGSLNAVGAGAVQNSIFGGSNNLTNSTHDSLSFGSNNIIDGYGNNIILGMNNIGNSNFGLIFGQYGKSRLFGQQVQSNARFTVGKIGEVQWSRAVLSGTSNSGAAIPLLLQDTAPTPATFQDGYSYDIQVRVLVVNTSPITPNPVVPARFVFDVLAHQESGTLVLDNINQTVITPNTSDDPSGAIRTVGWSVTLGVSGNQLTITVDPELDATNYVRPTGTPSNRRAVATIEMREMSRL